MPSPRVRRIARECLAVRVRLLNRLVTGLCDAGLRPFGVRTGQVNILVVLANAGPLTPTAASRVLVMDKSTFSRDVDHLRRNGWVDAESTDDGRSHTLRVTDAGLKLLEDIYPTWQAGQAEVAKVLGPAGAAAVVAAVDRVWAESSP
jgi:DNA-binding MarR family transcriptional regulator